MTQTFAGISLPLAMPEADHLPHAPVTKALFPDTPTARGTAHLEILAVRRRGAGAAILFIIQRHDAHSFTPLHEADRPSRWRLLARPARACRCWRCGAG